MAKSKKQTLTAVRILAVDDSPETIELIKRNLESLGHHVYTANSVRSAIKILDATPIQLVISDLKMPNENGLELIRYTLDNYKNVATLVITGFPSIQGAVESIKFGAEEYLVKPFTDEELFKAVDRALKKNESAIIQSNSNENHSFGIIGKSEGMLQVFRTIEKARTTKATVLITGESGTGKELVARALHYGSNTAASPFVPVNCGGIPDALLESELFGYVKGAFTGANESRAGFFQTAEGGTIFLDEISNTSMAMQAKLLRVLQDKEFYMVGSKKPYKANVKIVAATNVDLLQLVKKNLFREDLFYRLNIVTIDLPPLRERGNDITLLLDFFLKKYVHELQRYAWPGNVRELQNLVHRLVILADDNTIDVPDLPTNFRYTISTSKKLNRTLEDVEREYIEEVLAAHLNNISKSAITLGIDRKTLREKLKRYGKKIG
jgi:two-component system response regulator HydG